MPEQSMVHYWPNQRCQSWYEAYTKYAKIEYDDSDKDTSISTLPKWGDTNNPGMSTLPKWGDTDNLGMSTLPKWYDTITFITLDQDGSISKEENYLVYNGSQSWGKIFYYCQLGSLWYECYAQGDKIMIHTILDGIMYNISYDDYPQILDNFYQPFKYLLRHIGEANQSVYQKLGTIPKQ